MKIDKLLEEASENEREILEDPEGFDFRPVEDVEEDEIASVAPDDPWMDSAQVDLINENVEIRFSTQNSMERYVAVWSTDEFSIIESNGHTIIEGESSETQIYYLVSNDDVLMYDKGWRPTSYERPKDVAVEAPEIYRKALEGETDELDWSNDNDYVPPPEEDDF